MFVRFDVVRVMAERAEGVKATCDSVYVKAERTITKDA